MVNKNAIEVNGQARKTDKIPVKNASLDITVDHPLVAIYQASKCVFGGCPGFKLGTSCLDF